MADTFFEKFTRCAKVCGLFSLIVRFGCCGLAGQANSDHVVEKEFKLSPGSFPSVHLH